MLNLVDFSYMTVTKSYLFQHASNKKSICLIIWKLIDLHLLVKITARTLINRKPARVRRSDERRGRSCWCKTTKYFLDPGAFWSLNNYLFFAGGLRSLTWGVALCSSACTISFPPLYSPSAVSANVYHFHASLQSGIVSLLLQRIDSDSKTLAGHGLFQQWSDFPWWNCQ